jgi:thiol-disulfide isomerase/thioredoxin
MKFSAIPIVLLIFLSPLLYGNDDTPFTYSEVLKHYKGKIVYLDFWASWCAPCRKSFPWMNELKNKFDNDQFVVVSVNLDADEKLAEKFLSQVPANFPIIYDRQGDLASELQLKGMPSSFLINAKGKVVSAHMGFTEKKKLRYEQEIRELLQGNHYADN